MLINNPRFYKRYHRCLVNPNRIKRLRNKLLSKVGIQQVNSNLVVPARSTSLFLGNNHSSFNSLDILPSLYRLIDKRRRHKYSLVIGKGDYCFDIDKWAGAPDNLVRLVANNITVDDPRVGYLPMGRDFRGAQDFKYSQPTSRKDILCYCNYSMDTHPVRRELYASISHLDFITFEHMGNFMNYSISRPDFYQKLARSKFAICPRGNGLDTFRLWDCLYSGTIPIVVNEAVFHREMQDLPVLFLDSYQDFAKLTRQYLENCYVTMLDKSYNYSKLLLSSWLI